MNYKKVLNPIILSLLFVPWYNCAESQSDALVNDTMLNQLQPESPSDYQRLLDRFEEEWEEEDPNLLDLLDTAPAEYPSFRLNPEDIINIIVLFNGLELLQEDLFLRTNVLNQQSLLDIPMFEIHNCCPKRPWLAGAYLFWNKTNRSNFTAKSTDFCSYLALSSPTLIDRLQSLIDQLPEEFDLDIARIFQLFQRMTVEQRRTGFMFYAIRQWETMTFRMMLPFYYLERNFSLTPEEQQAVEREFGAMDPRQQEQFQKAHLISDKLGFGDMRLELDSLVVDNDTYQLRIGGQATIPMAFTVAQSIKGSSFDECFSRVTFDFNNVLELIDGQPLTPELTQTIFSIFRNFFLNAFDRIAANLITSKLGNNGHLGLGIFMRTEVPLTAFIKRAWAERIIYQGRTSIEYLFPSVEKRFYIFKSDTAGFENRDFADESMAAENLQFLEKEFVNKYYLNPFNTLVQPGPIFRWMSKICYCGKYVDVTLGSDLWVQWKEHFLSIGCPKQIIRQLCVQKAKPPMAYKAKIFGGLAYKMKRRKRDWLLGLNGETTTTNSGIGQDWTVSLNLEINF